MIDEPLEIRPYDPAYGATVARWGGSCEALFWLAPSSCWPLTGDQVTGWVNHSTDQPLLLFQAGREIPCGYAELNPLRSSNSHLWIGHVVIDPADRGRGLGRRFMQMLTERAWSDPNVDRLTMVVFPENRAALRCYETIGFGIIGRERHQFGTGNKNHLMLRLELTRHHARRLQLALAAGQ